MEINFKLNKTLREKKNFSSPLLNHLQINIKKILKEKKNKQSKEDKNMINYYKILSSVENQNSI